MVKTMNVCKCENLSLWGAFDVINSTRPFPIDGHYVKVVQFDFSPKLRTRRFLVFCGTLLPVGPDDGANRDVIVKCRRDRPASDDYWTLYFTRMDIGRHILAKYDDATDGKRNDHEIDFADVFEAKMAGFSYWEEFCISLKEYYHRRMVDGEHVIIEEYLPGKFEKFDNTVDSFVQSFQHFSYHYSEREFLLFGLEGVQFDDFYKLTVPFVHSRKKEFGPRDRGEKGINEFFVNHVCSDICRKWTTPKRIRRKTKASVDTGVIDHVEVNEKDNRERIRLNVAGARFSKPSLQKESESSSDESSETESEEEESSEADSALMNDEYIDLSSKPEKNERTLNFSKTQDHKCSKESLMDDKSRKQEAYDKKLARNGYKPGHSEKLSAINLSSRDLTQKSPSERDQETSSDNVFYIQDINLDLKNASLNEGSRSEATCVQNGDINVKPKYLNNNDPKQEELNNSRRKLANNEIVIHCNYLGEKYFGSNGIIKSTAI